MSRKSTAKRLKPPRANVYTVPEFKPLKGAFGAVLVPRVVEDPYRDRQKEEHETSTVMADIRRCPLGRAYAEGRIDKAEYDAGIQWLGFYEVATLGDLKGYEIRTPVDGAGAFPEFMSDRRKKALEELATAKREIGSRGHKLLEEVLGNRRFISELASSLGYLDGYGKPMKRMVYHMNLLFKSCLEDLANLYGFVNKPHRVNGRI